MSTNFLIKHFRNVFLISGFLISSIGLCKLATPVFAQEEVAGEKYKSKIIMLEEKPRTIKAGIDVILSPKAPLPVYGKDTSLCFAVGKPIDSANPNKDEQKKVRDFLNSIFEAKDASGARMDPKRFMRGAVTGADGKTQPFTAVIPSNIAKNKEGTILQISVCGEYAQNEEQAVKSITFRLSQDIDAESIYWTTTDTVEKSEKEFQQQSEAMMAERNKPDVPFSQDSYVFKHQGECKTADIYKDIDRVVLFLDIDPGVSFADVPDLKSDAVAKSFSAEESSSYNPAPFAHCLNKTGLKTAVVYEAGGKYGPNDLVLHVKVSRRGDNPKYENLEISYQMIQPSNDDGGLVELPDFQRFKNSGQLIMKEINQHVGDYLLMRMGYVTPPCCNGG